VAAEAAEAAAAAAKKRRRRLAEVASDKPAWLSLSPRPPPPPRSPPPARVMHPIPFPISTFLISSGPFRREDGASAAAQEVKYQSP